MFSKHEPKQGESTSGVATVGLTGMKADKWQVYCIPSSGTSVVTVKVRLPKDTTPRSFIDNTISLSDPVPLIIEGNADGFVATAATDTDEYTLVVGPLYT